MKLFLENNNVDHNANLWCKKRLLGKIKEEVVSGGVKDWILLKVKKSFWVICLLIARKCGGNARGCEMKLNGKLKLQREGQTKDEVKI